MGKASYGCQRSTEDRYGRHGLGTSWTGTQANGVAWRGEAGSKRAVKERHRKAGRRMDHRGLAGTDWSS